MKVIFKNERKDLEVFYDYMVKETQEGKDLGRRLRNSKLIGVILFSIWLGWYVGTVTGSWIGSIIYTVVMFIFTWSAFLLLSRFKPSYYFAVQAYKDQEKGLTSQDLEIFTLPKTVTIDEKWIEFRNSEALHRYRWRIIKKIGVTSKFIYIHAGNYSVYYIPKRDFVSERAFLDFGNTVQRFKQMDTDQPIGTE